MMMQIPIAFMKLSGTGDIVFIVGGTAAGMGNLVSYSYLASTGAYSEFTRLVSNRNSSACLSNRTRGAVLFGVNGGTINNEIVTYATKAVQAEGSNSSPVIDRKGAGSNDTNGIVGGGSSAVGVHINTITAFTLSNLVGSSFVGNLSVSKARLGASANDLKIVFTGGDTGTSTPTSVMEQRLFATTGNATNFGSLITARSNHMGGCSSPTRGVTCGGTGAGGTSILSMEYITFSSASNATTFGNLRAASTRTYATGSHVKGVIGNSVATDIITIANAGNSTEFAVLGTGSDWSSSMSNCHGGLV